jgi:hypothetical protein
MKLWKHTISVINRDILFWRRYLPAYIDTWHDNVNFENLTSQKCQLKKSHL